MTFDSLWVRCPEACFGLVVAGLVEAGPAFAKATAGRPGSATPATRSGFPKCPGACPGDVYWFSEEVKQHYSGPGESWWGTDLALVPRGQGRCLVSQLRIVGNLGKDPVADKILFNLIEWIVSGKW